MIVHNFETTVTVPQHTVVVPKPACSYQNYTTFQRYFQVFSQFCVLELSYSLYPFLFTYIFMWLSVPLLGASGTRGFRPAQMRSSGWVWWGGGWRVEGCIDRRNWVMGYCWFLKVTFEVIEGVLMCWRIRLLLICDVHCCLFAQSLLCLCSPMLFFCWNFTGCNFGLWNKKQVYYCSI